MRTYTDVWSVYGFPGSVTDRIGGEGKGKVKGGVLFTLETHPNVVFATGCRRA